MSWLIKIEFDCKRSMLKFAEGLEPHEELAYGILDYEFEELEEDDMDFRLKREGLKWYSYFERKEGLKWYDDV